MSDATCIACGESVAGDFCSNCGENQRNKRITWGVVVSEFLSNVLEWEYPLLRTVKDLTTRPGHLCRDYVKGIRRPYSRPFQYYLISLAVFYLFFLAAGLQISDYSQDFMPDFAEGDIGEQQRALTARINAAMNEYSKIIMFIFVPISSMWTWLLFRKSGFNYAENFIMYLYITAHTTLLTMIFIPLSFIDFSYYFTSTWLIGTLYTFFAFKQFFGVSVGEAILKGLATYVLGMIVFSILAIGTTIIIIRFFGDYGWI